MAEGFRRSEEREQDHLFTVGKDASKTPEADTAALETRRRHEQLMERYADEQSAQADNRYQMAVDEDFFDGLQWSEQDALELIGRGQAPVVYNHCKTRVKWVTGTQKRTKIDYKVLPRRREEAKPAEVKTKVLKYVGDINQIQFHRAQAFEIAMTAGLAWLEDGVTTDPTKERVYSSHESWRSVWRDRHARLFNLEDARYLFRNKKVDLDLAQALFPDKAAALANNTTDFAGSSTWENDEWFMGERLVNAHSFDGRGGIFSASGTYARRGAFVSTAQADTGRREMTNLIESWYKVPARGQFLSGGAMGGLLYDEKNERHAWEVAKGFATLAEHAFMQMRCMISTEDLVLWDGVSPYRHNRFPLVPLWCYRRKKDGEPYGIIRDIRDPQESLNKRKSKSLYILSNNRIVMDEGAVEDEDELRDEAARPDAVIIKKSGKELRFEKSMAEFQGNVELMNEDAQFMQVGTGVTDENMGRKTNATSGVAIEARQDQGSVVSADLFDCLRMAVQMQGENQLSLCEQFMSEQKVVRITGESPPLEWLEINKVDEDTGEVLNDITASQADFIIAEQDFRATIRQAQFQQMADMLAKMAQTDPRIALSLLDLLVEMADDLPKRDEWLARIRKLNGQTDPDKELTPQEQAEVQARREQEAAEQAEAKELQKRQLMAAIGKLEGEAKKAGAQAGTYDAQALAAAVGAVVTALEGAPLLFTPGVAAATDQILQGVGFKDQGGEGLDVSDGTLPTALPAPVTNPAGAASAAAGLQPPAQGA